MWPIVNDKAFPFDVYCVPIKIKRGYIAFALQCDIALSLSVQ